MMKTTLLFVAIFFATSAFAQTIQPLQIPPRPADAIGGAEFMQSLIPMTLADREAAIYREAVSGNIPQAFRQLARIETTRQDANGINQTIVLEVMPDFLAIGSDDDFYRIPLLPMTAQRIADAFGAILPTTIVSDLAWQYAEIRLNPWLLTHPPGPDMTTVPIFIDHNRRIEALRIPYGKPLSALIAGHKKDIIITNQMYTHAAGMSRVWIYGWHQLNGVPIQNTNGSHSLDYTDYSHGVRLINQQMMINGETRNVRDVLRDPIMFRLISRYNEIMRVTEYGGEPSGGETPGDRETPDNYPHPEQDANTMALDFYNFEYRGSLDAPWLNENNIRRAIHRNGQLYVLTQAPNPRIFIVNPTTLELIREMDLTGISGGWQGRTISDIAFTADGKLLACNMDILVFPGNVPVNPDGVFRVYIWEDDNAAPEIFFEINTGGAVAGNWVNGRLGDAMAVSGPSWDATIYVSAASATAPHSMRIVAFRQVEDRPVTHTRRHFPADAVPNIAGWGFDFQFMISPLGDNDRILVTSNSVTPFEVRFDWAAADASTTLTSTAFAAECGFGLFQTNGANFFRYAGRAYMVAPTAEAGRTNVGVALFDITDGLDNAVKISDVLDAGFGNVAAGYMMAFGVVNNRNITLSVLAENNGLATFTFEVPTLELVLGTTPDLVNESLLTVPFLVNVGDTVHLGIRIAGNSTWESPLEYTLTSSNPAVATINTSGAVAALAHGATTISVVRSLDGADGAIMLIVMDDTVERPDNFPHPEQEASVVPQDFYAFYHHKTLDAAPWLNENNIRRAIHRNGQLYILTQAPNPRIFIINPTTLELIREMDLTGVLGGLNGVTLSDIAFTADDKLLATNLAVVSSTTRAENTTGAPRLTVYIWDNDDAQPRIFYELYRNMDAPAGSHEAMLGNYGNGFWFAGRLGETMAVSGPSWDAVIYMPAFSANEVSGVGETFRMVAHVVRHGVLVQTGFRMRVGGTPGAPFNVADGTNFGGTGFQLHVSPLADDRIILTSSTNAPTEFRWDWSEANRATLHQTGVFAAECGFSLVGTKGVNYFRHAGGVYMAAPITNASRTNVGVALFDVTDGLNNAVKISEHLDAEFESVDAATYIKAFGVVNNEHIALYVLAENQGFARFATYQLPGVGLPELSLRNNIRVFPNPVQNVLNIDADFEIRSIRLVDLTGRTVMNIQTSQRTVDMSNVPAGNYILLVNDIPVRIVKQ